MLSPVLAHSPHLFSTGSTSEQDRPAEVETRKAREGLVSKVLRCERHGQDCYSSYPTSPRQ